MTERSIDRKAIYEVLDDLITRVCPEVGEERRHMRRLLYTAVLVAKDQPDTLDLKIMDRALRELRKGFKAFAPWSDKRKIAVFGSARTEHDAPEFKMAEDCARQLVQEGFMVVTGAGPGIMEAANKGAGRENSFGVNILLPFEAEANQYIADDPKLVNFRYFFTRKVVFVKETDGTILFPGGFGTQDEGFETLTLVQTGKTEPRPIVMIEPPGSTYWRDWDEWVRKGLVDRGLVSPGDLGLYEIVDNPREAVEKVAHFYRNFHSIRYIDDRLIIRMRVQPSKFLVERLNYEFGEILVSGEIEPCDIHLYEYEEPEVADLHRLRLHFDQRHLGRLRALIDVLNDAVTPAQAATSPSIKPVHWITPHHHPDTNGDSGDDD